MNSLQQQQSASPHVGHQMLYDSDNFVVVWVGFERPLEFLTEIFGFDASRMRPDHIFEIVDKRTNREVILQDAWAETFQNQIKRWLENAPEQDEVEAALGTIVDSIASQPLVVH